ncbi:mitogen-activated protein kinase binding protein 1 [Homalodisca vitripennis]|nr:mitogen-activated protein kinase binding protein 1 [Homalodisca vitripennis]
MDKELRELSLYLVPKGLFQIFHSDRIFRMGKVGDRGQVLLRSIRRDREYSLSHTMLKEEEATLPVTMGSTQHSCPGIRGAPLTPQSSSTVALSVHLSIPIFQHLRCTVVLFNSAKNRQSHLLNLSRKTVTCVKFSPDGRLLATGENGHLPNVRVWDLADGSQVAEFPGHKYGISCVAFSPSQKYLVSVGCEHDMIVNVWEWKSGVKVASNKVSNKVKAVAFADNGNYFVTAGNRLVKFWYLEYSRSAKYKEPVPLMGRSAILGEQRNNDFCDVACGKGEMGDSTYAITRSGLLCEFNNRRLLDKWVELRDRFAVSSTVSDEGGVRRVGLGRGVPHNTGLWVDALSCVRVFEWHKMFKEGRELVTASNVAKVKTVLAFDRRLNIAFIREETGLSRISMRKVCAKVSSEEQKLSWVEILQENLDCVQEDEVFLDNVITGNESKEFKGYQFDSIKAVLEATTKVLNSIPETDFQRTFDKWQCFSPQTLQYITTLPRPHYLGVDIAQGTNIRFANT